MKLTLCSSSPTQDHSSVGVDPPRLLPLDRLTVEYLQRNPEVLEDFSKEMKMSVSIDTDKWTLVLQPDETTPTTDSPDDSSIVKQFQLLLANTVSSVDFDMPSGTVNDDIRLIVTQHCTKEKLSFEFHQGRVSVAGLNSLVESLECQLQKNCGGVVQTTEECTFSLRDYVIVTRVKVLEIENEYRQYGVRVLANDAKRSLSITGPLQNVLQFKQYLPTLIGQGKVALTIGTSLIAV